MYCIFLQTTRQASGKTTVNPLWCAATSNSWRESRRGVVGPLLMTAAAIWLLLLRPPGRFGRAKGENWPSDIPTFTIWLRRAAAPQQQQHRASEEETLEKPCCAVIKTQIPLWSPSCWMRFPTLVSCPASTESFAALPTAANNHQPERLIAGRRQLQQRGSARRFQNWSFMLTAMPMVRLSWCLKWLFWFLFWTQCSWLLADQKRF